MRSSIQITFLAATRASEDIFWSCSPLGLSVKRLESIQHLVPDAELQMGIRYRSHIRYENRQGLSDVYNSLLDDVFAEQEVAVQGKVDSWENEDEILVFIHDDVWIDDAQIGEHLIAGLRRFDVIGVAGSVARQPGQPAWCLLDLGFKVNRDKMSGMICHGRNPCGSISFFGPWGQSCELLDGVLIAVGRQNLLSAGLRFDSRFEFHFYDMDFCRTARSLGLRLGTWPMAITHQSKGGYGEEWSHCFSSYLAKWGD